LATVTHIIVRELIKEDTEIALPHLEEIEPFTLEAPHTVKMEFLHTGLADVVEIVPFVKRTVQLTISFVTDDVMECYQLIRSSIMIAGSVS